MRKNGSWTPIGDNVAVLPTDDITLIFEKVTEAGVTIVKKPDTGPAPPRGLTIEQYYEIKTEASCQGMIEIRIIRASDKPQVDLNRIRLWQWNEETKEWEAIPVRFEPKYNLIVGKASHLSIFGVTR